MIDFGLKFIILGLVCFYVAVISMVLFALFCVFWHILQKLTQKASKPMREFE